MKDISLILNIIILFILLYIILYNVLWKPPLPMEDNKPQHIAMVLSCMDYRFVDQVADVLDQIEKVKTYDRFVLAGASLGYNAGPSSWQTTWIQHVDMARKYHNIQEIIILEHEDCAYYKGIYNVKQDSIEMHKENTHKFIRVMQTLYPQLTYSAYIIKLNGQILELY